MKKLLAIDIGNSKIKYGLFENGTLTYFWKHESKRIKQEAPAILAQTAAPCALASVVPESGEQIKSLLGKRLAFELSGSTQGTIKNMPAEMGADRVADALAAWRIYGKAKRGVVVMSFGTASTLLAIDKTGNQIGGWIAPGLSSQLELMHQRCALLPKLSSFSPSCLLGSDTETHMGNGVFVASIGAARAWIQTARLQLGDKKALSIATGGWSGTLQEHGKIFDRVDANLTLKGIYLAAQEALV